MTPSKLRVRDVSHQYVSGGRTRPVLDNVNLDVMANDSVAIIGTTGVGKSTLLRILAGFEKPTRGAAEVFESEAWTPIEPNPNIGYLFQQPNLFPWLKVDANVQFGARYARTYGRKELEGASHAGLSQVGLADAGNLYPYQLSGGMKARAALARVFVTKPQVLLMDEPFGALDALTRRSMYLLLHELIASSPQLATVLITHDVDEAITLCNRIVVMCGSPGKIAASFRSEFWRQRDDTEMQRAPDYVALKSEILGVLELQRNRSDTVEDEAPVATPIQNGEPRRELP